VESTLAERAPLVGLGWQDQPAPSLDDFEIVAKAAFEALPEPFKGMTQGVPCMVAEFPDEETLDEHGVESEFDLMGLFRGIGRTEEGMAPQTGRMPNQVWLYRRPILDYWAEHEETLGAVITHVLIHEIGHHFGFSDDDMEAIEAAAEAEQG
jgi:predicted Zn-dependent protease with MMP-like domain